MCRNMSNSHADRHHWLLDASLKLFSSVTTPFTVFSFSCCSSRSQTNSRRLFASARCPTEAQNATSATTTGTCTPTWPASTRRMWTRPCTAWRPGKAYKEGRKIRGCDCLLFCKSGEDAWRRRRGGKGRGRIWGSVGGQPAGKHSCLPLAPRTQNSSAACVRLITAFLLCSSLFLSVCLQTFSSTTAEEVRMQSCDVLLMPSGCRGLRSPFDGSWRSWRLSHQLTLC